MIILTVVILVVGFVLLAEGANFFVDGAAAVAKKLRIPVFIIGMTVVAMGTSLPECAVTITASIRGNNAMAVSNVIGSNAFNLLVVCGVCAAITPLAIKKSTLRREFPVSVLAEVVLLAMCLIGTAVGHAEGIILLALFVLFLVWTVRSAKKNMQSGGEPEEEAPRSVGEDGGVEPKDLSNTRCFLYIVFGAAAVVFGGWLVVRSAETIALWLGMSETLVGLTVCAIGTSVPELITSITAARKHHADMALGNVIGSNIFNVLLVAGVACAISPIAVSWSDRIDLIFVIGVSVLIMLMVRKRQELRRGGGICLLVLYAAFMVYICLRDTGTAFLAI